VSPGPHPRRFHIARHPHGAADRLRGFNSFSEISRFGSEIACSSLPFAFPLLKSPPLPPLPPVCEHLEVHHPRVLLPVPSILPSLDYLFLTLSELFFSAPANVAAVLFPSPCLPNYASGDSANRSGFPLLYLYPFAQVAPPFSFKSPLDPTPSDFSYMSQRPCPFPAIPLYTHSSLVKFGVLFDSCPS